MIVTGIFRVWKCLELDAGWQRNSRDSLCIVDWISDENSLQFRGVEQRKFYWCGFCHRVADKGRNRGFWGRVCVQSVCIFGKS